MCLTVRSQMKSAVPFLYITCLFIILYKLQMHRKPVWWKLNNCSSQCPVLYQRNKYDCMKTHFPLYRKSSLLTQKEKNINEVKLFIQICIASNSRIAFGTHESFFLILQLFRTWTPLSTTSEHHLPKSVVISGHKCSCHYPLCCWGDCSKTDSVPIVSYVKKPQF